MYVFCFQSTKTFMKDFKYSKFLKIPMAVGVLGSQKGLGVARARQLQPLEKPTCHSCRWHHLHHHARVLVRTGLGWDGVMDLDHIHDIDAASFGTSS